MMHDESRIPAPLGRGVVKTDPATVFADRLSAVRQSMAAFEARWRAWAALQPVNQVCHRHAQVRPRLDQTSLEKSWQKKELAGYSP